MQSYYRLREEREEGWKGRRRGEEGGGEGGRIIVRADLADVFEAENVVRLEGRGGERGSDLMQNKRAAGSHLRNAVQDVPWELAGYIGHLQVCGVDVDQRLHR